MRPQRLKPRRYRRDSGFVLTPAVATNGAKRIVRQLGDDTGPIYLLRTLFGGAGLALGCKSR